jgi:cyclopropane fatty-acyl-phospholipid synthase-like methyltransferase
MDQAFDPEAVRAFEYARWQGAAAVYGNTFASATGPFIEALLDAALVADGACVLDVGCGPGFVASAARARGATVHGLDFSLAMLAIARARENAVASTRGMPRHSPTPTRRSTRLSPISAFTTFHAPAWQ